MGDIILIINSRTLGGSENLGGGGEIINTRSFVGTDFSFNSGGGWVNAFPAPLVPPALLNYGRHNYEYRKLITYPNASLVEDVTLLRNNPSTIHSN